MKNGIPYYMKGAFCQFEFNGQTVFIEIHTCEYDEPKISRLKRNESLDQSIIGSFLRLIRDGVPTDTRYLYKLESYYANKEIKSAWEFNESISDFQIKGFFSIDKLLEYCETTWSIGTEDFTPRDETDIP